MQFGKPVKLFLYRNFNFYREINLSKWQRDRRVLARVTASTDYRVACLLRSLRNANN